MTHEELLKHLDDLHVNIFDTVKVLERVEAGQMKGEDARVALTDARTKIILLRADFSHTLTEINKRLLQAKPRPARGATSPAGKPGTIGVIGGVPPEAKKKALVAVTNLNEIPFNTHVVLKDGRTCYVTNRLRKDGSGMAECPKGSLPVTVDWIDIEGAFL